VIKYLKHHPSKLKTWLFLIIGLALFISVYSYMIKLYSEIGISKENFNTVWLSFDSEKFYTFFQQVIYDGNLNKFLYVFKLNIISISAFMVAFYGLSLIIARQIEPTSRVYKMAYIFPIFPTIIAIFDIIPSVLILTLKSVYSHFPVWLSYIISGGYVIRVLLLYVLLIWFISTIIWFTIRKVRKAKM